MKNSIYPCLWFDGQAKEAADFYCATFKNSKITDENPMVVNFELDGQKFMGLNGGSMFKINPSISFFVVCETEAEIDATWQKLTEGGMVMMAMDKYPWSEKYGFCQDKFGLSWQLSYGKLADVGQKITPSLMFVGEQHGKAEQAINFYTSIFDNSSITGILKYTADDTDTEGTVKHAQFSLNQYVMMAMDSSAKHAFQFNEAISLVVNCENQQEIDFYWNKLTDDGGAESRCGWLKDKFGISWQIVPVLIGELMSHPTKSQAVMQEVMKMNKIELGILQQTYAEA